MRRFICLLLIISYIIIPVKSSDFTGTVWLDSNPATINCSDEYFIFSQSESNIFGTVYSFESKKAGNNQMIDFGTSYKVNTGEGAGYIYLSFYYKGYSEYENYLGNTVSGTSCYVYPQFRFAHNAQDVYINGSKAFKSEMNDLWIKKSVVMKINASSSDNAKVNLRFKINLLENFKIDITAPTLIYFGENANENDITKYLKENGYYYNKIQQSEEAYSKYGIELSGEFYNNKKHLWQAQTTSEGVVKEHILRNWLNEMLPEIRVNNILNGNYAFVDGSKFFWNSDKKAVMSAPAVITANGNFLIPGDVAYSLFGVGDGTNYFDIDKIENIHIFKDSRGFVLLSKNPVENSLNLDINQNGYYNSAYDVADCIGTITWQDISPNESDYDAFRKSWLEDITYPENTAEKYAEFINEAIAKAKENLELYTTDNICPFSDIEIPDVSANQEHFVALESVYSRLREMAIGYRIAVDTGNKTVDVSALENAVLSGVELMHRKYYSNNAYRADGTPRFTTFKFKIPEALSDILLCMYNEIEYNTLKKYVDEAIGRNILPTVTQGEDIYSDYTNRLWATIPYIKMAVLIKDKVKINHGYRYLSQIFDENSRNSKYPIGKNGFFEDGSFVFHDSFAYNTGYGKSYITAIAEFSNTTKGTVFDVSKVYGYERLYRYIADSYLPFIYDFKNMKITAGRENAFSNARSLVTACILIANNAPENTKAELASKIKAVIESGTNATAYLTKKTRFDTFTYLAYPEIVEINRSFINYLSGIEGENSDHFSKIYYNMDRVLHKTEKFTFGLSLSSSRIQKYESSSTKPASLTQWYTGDGMTYFDDKCSQSWFDNANPYFMPGTTVDETVRSIEQTFNLTSDEWGLPENDFAGGVSNGKISVAGMELGNKWISGLKGRKSYFMLDNEIVCMGTGIADGNGNAYTVVDNKTFSDSGDIYVNGSLVSDSSQKSENIKSVWTEDNFGYILIDNDCVTIKREEYKEGNPHFVMTIEHGTQPTEGKYLYAVLPSATKTETLNYGKNPEFEVISQTNSLHAIKRKSDGMILANIFEPCSLYGFDFKNPCSVIIDGGTLYVSDPTMKQNEIVFDYDKERKIDVSALKGAGYICELPEFNGYFGEIKLNGGKFDGELFTDNNTDTSLNATLCMAVYNKDKLVDCVAEPFEIKGNSTNVKLESEINYPDSEFTEVKMYLWHNSEPLCEAVTYTKK